jgi:hypothetical protein
VFSGSASPPSLAVAWDATHDGRTVLRGSFSEYLDVEVTSIAGHTLGSQVSQRCTWNEANQAYDGACTYSGGASSTSIGLPCGPSGLDATGRSCRSKLSIPKTWEYTAGAEREVIQGLALGRQLRIPPVQEPVRDHGDQPPVEPSGPTWRWVVATATAGRTRLRSRDAERSRPALHRADRLGQPA